MRPSKWSPSVRAALGPSGRGGARRTVHSRRLRRGWIAAAAMVAVALGAALPSQTLAQIRAVTPTSPVGVVGVASFETLGPPDASPVEAAAPALLTAPAAIAEVAPPPPPAPPRPARATRGRSAAPGIAVPSGPAVGSGTWAFIVGIDDYPGERSDLGAAVNDANDVERAMLVLGARADQVLTLRDTQATGDAIRAGLDWLMANAGPDAVAVFFYAGHVIKLGEESEAMVAADGNQIGDVELAERLSRLAARQAWIAIAACYGGGFNEVLAPGRILTGAASSTGLAYENDRFNRSYMVEYMVRQALIERRAAESVQAAFQYAIAAMGEEYPGRQPVQYDATDRPLDLRPPPPRPPSPSTQDQGGAGTTPPTTAPPPSGCWKVVGRFCG